MLFKIKKKLKLELSLLDLVYLFLVPFNYDGNLSYNHGFNGGYSFKESNDYKLKFTSRFSANRSVVLNILWFTPAILDLTNGELNEILS